MQITNSMVKLWQHHYFNNSLRGKLPLQSYLISLSLVIHNFHSERMEVILITEVNIFKNDWFFVYITTLENHISFDFFNIIQHTNSINFSTTLMIHVFLSVRQCSIWHLHGRAGEALPMEGATGMCRGHDPFFQASRRSLSYKFNINALLMCPLPIFNF